MECCVDPTQLGELSSANASDDQEKDQGDAVRIRTNGIDEIDESCHVTHVMREDNE